MEPYATVKEAAIILRCCPETVRRMLREEKLPFIRLGNTYRIPVKSLFPSDDTGIDELLA